MYLIGTNIFLDILLEQKKADNCARFVEDAVRQQTACLVAAYTLHSMEIILINLKRIPALVAFWKIY